MRYSWHPGCPVAPSALRMITMTYRGFDHKVHTGRMVVNAAVTGKLILVFRKLFEMRFPIRRMVPVDAYHGSDFASIQADNTSSFNCRDATGSSTWSEHAYGLAVDLDPCENPYVYANGYEAHQRCRKYVDRSLQDPGIIHAGDQVVRAFASVGWGWAASGPVTAITSTSPRTAGDPRPARTLAPPHTCGSGEGGSSGIGGGGTSPNAASAADIPP